MLVEIPEYYSDFTCIGAHCKDNCCIGWEIDIDKKTFEKYREVKGAFGERLRTSISDEDTPHFMLREERCPFLNEQNLCDIILTLGEEQLCEICNLHPRFFTQYGNRCAMGIGLCCEAAAELILSQTRAVQFFVEKSDEAGEESPLCNWLYNMKTNMIALLQNRDVTITDRLAAALSFAEKIQAQLERKDYISQIEACVFENGQNQSVQGKTALCGLLSIYQSLEPLDLAWIQRLKQVEEKINVLAEKSALFTEKNPELCNDYEQLSVYFIHRYWLRAGEDQDVLGKVHLMLASILIIRLLELEMWCDKGELTRANQIEVVKAYSKEIEYSEQNIEALAEASLEHPAFLRENLLAAIMW